MENQILDQKCQTTCFRSKNNFLRYLWLKVLNSLKKLHVFLGFFTNNSETLHFIEKIIITKIEADNQIKKLRLHYYCCNSHINRVIARWSTPFIRREFKPHCSTLDPKNVPFWTILLADFWNCIKKFLTWVGKKGAK